MEVDQMENSILTSLAGIHAAVLSIVAALTIAFYFFAESQTHTLSEKLNDARHEVARTMTMPFLMRATSLDYGDYVNDDSVDLPRIQRELLELCGYVRGTPPQEELPAPDRGERLIDLISLLSDTYPYADRLRRTGQGWSMAEPQRKPYDRKWHDNLLAMNSVLLVSKKPIVAEVAEFEKRDRQEHSPDYSADLSLQKADLGFFTGPTQMVADFYNRLEFIQTNVVPKIEDNAFKLSFYQERFKTKTRLVQMLVTAIMVFFAGILLPLVLHLLKISDIYVQLVVLLTTLVPYLLLLSFLLWAVARWKSS
jgi:hypothetical protein